MLLFYFQRDKKGIEWAGERLRCTEERVGSNLNYLIFFIPY